MIDPLYADFSIALTDPGRSAKRFPPRRFAVYRNNVAVSLVGAMKAQFPAVTTLLGDELFSRLALAYVRQVPPRSVLLFEIGEAYDSFLRDSGAIARHPFVADVARLEYLMACAQHAADAAITDAAVLLKLSEVELQHVTFEWHPAAHLFEANSPAVTICRENRDGGEPSVIARWTGESALITRPSMAVDVRLLPVGGHAFLSAIRSGQTLELAAAKGFEANGEFDLATNIAGMFAAGAIAGFFTETKERQT